MSTWEYRPHRRVWCGTNRFVRYQNCLATMNTDRPDRSPIPGTSTNIWQCMCQRLNSFVIMTCIAIAHHALDAPMSLHCAHMAIAMRILWNCKNEEIDWLLVDLIAHKIAAGATHLVSSFSCWCCDVEQKNRSSKLTFCIKTTHNWFSKITSRFSTSVGYLTPKLDVSIFNSGRKNDSCTSNSWCRECVTNCSYSFSCSSRTASEYLRREAIQRIYCRKSESKSNVSSYRSVVLLHSYSLSRRFSLSKYSRHGAGGEACVTGGGYLLQLCNSISNNVTIWSKWLTTPITSSWLVVPFDA